MDKEDAQFAGILIGAALRLAVLVVALYYVSAPVYSFMRDTVTELRGIRQEMQAARGIVEVK